MPSSGRIRRLRSDNGGEICNSSFDSFCRQRGILREFTSPYSPEQNGKCERMNRTLMDKARSMLHGAGLSFQFWPYAIDTAAFLVNRSATSSNGSGFQTPFELWYGSSPDLSNLRVFGCTCFLHIPSSLRSKLDAKAEKGIFLGYDLQSVCYRVWVLSSKQVKLSVHVTFNETLPESTPS